MDITPYIGAIATVLIAVIAGYAAISSRIAKLETVIEEREKTAKAERDANHEEIVNLRREVEKHNNVLERVYSLEQDTAVQEQRITANEARIKKLEGAA